MNLKGCFSFMIRINLLPKTHKEKFSPASKELTLFIALLLCVVLIAAGYEYKLQNRIQRLEKLQTEKEAERNNLLDQLQTVREMQKQLEKTQDKIEIIKKIRLKQPGPVRYLDTIASNMPQDKIWLNYLHIDEQGFITLQGIALDNQSFAAYLQQLRASPYIADISLRQTSREIVNNLDLVAFECRIKSAPKN